MLKKIKISKYNETIYYEKLENGLEVYMWPNSNVSSFYATLSVKYGSVDTSFKIKNNKIHYIPQNIIYKISQLKRFHFLFAYVILYYPWCFFRLFVLNFLDKI